MRKYLVEAFMNKHIRKPLFGSSYIFFNDYLIQSAILSNYSLSLGLLFKDDFGLLLELLGNAKTEVENNIKGLIEMAELIENDLNSNVISSYSLFSEVEIKNTIELFFKDKVIDYQNPLDLLKIKNERIPEKALILMTEMLIYKMIGFSYRYPEKAKQLLSYKADRNDYELALKSGLDVTQFQSFISIEDHLNLAKELVRPYIQSSRPDLISQLDW